MKDGRKTYRAPGQHRKKDGGNPHLSKRDKVLLGEFQKMLNRQTEEIKKIFIESQTFDVKMIKKNKDVEGGQETVEMKSQYAPAFWTEYLPNVEGRLQGLLSTVTDARNRSGDVIRVIAQWTEAMKLPMMFIAQAMKTPELMQMLEGKHPLDIKPQITNKGKDNDDKNLS